MIAPPEGDIMNRTMIRITEDQTRKLKCLAARRNVSVAALIREAVDALLESPGTRSSEELRARSLSVAGRYHSGKSVVSARHDDYLAGDYSR
jgi:hypothetical protein